MTRISIVSFVAAALAVAALGCNKPSDANCRKAIANMRSLMGTDSPTSTASTEGDVRRCKGGSSKKAVECAMNAKTLDELRACDFMKIPAKAGSAATEPAGGSAAAGSATSEGSAGGSAEGAAAGSGSATGGPAAGSGDGSAAGGW